MQELAEGPWAHWEGCCILRAYVGSEEYRDGRLGEEYVAREALRENRPGHRPLRFRYLWKARVR